MTTELNLLTTANNIIFALFSSTEIQDVFNRNNCATTTTTTTTTPTAPSSSAAAAAAAVGGGIDDSNVIPPLRHWLVMMHNKVHEIPWHQLRHVKWMNKRATGQTAYVPTDVSLFLFHI